MIATSRAMVAAVGVALREERGRAGRHLAARRVFGCL
jgi:hypothetical protein